MYSQDGTLIYRETIAGGINYIYLGNRLIAKDGFIPENSSDQHFYPYGSSVEGEIDDTGYTGHKFDTDLQLSYMQARYYDPMIGRFYSNDPMRFSNVHNFNRYTYANNNPYKYIYPDGKAAELRSMQPIVFKRKFNTALNYLREAGVSGPIDRLIESETVTVIIEDNSGFFEHAFVHDSMTILFDPNGGLDLPNGGIQSPALGLLHEAIHAEQFISNPEQFLKDLNTEYPDDLLISFIRTLKKKELFSNSKLLLLRK
ncbi:RHS repeat-associated core domain-containing protein [Alteromonadaceae bacterium M269]|nr:RHS repeat-associated core domain-containing protein [Alteromonadaceae bacterium M269]